MGSVAIMDGEELIAEQCLNVGATHAERLIKSIDEILAHAGLKMHDVDGLAVAIGPGSFTGLRIGLATVKGLALAERKPIVAVSSLKALAYNAFGFFGIIVPIFDAKRGQVYASAYRSSRSLPFPPLVKGRVRVGSHLKEIFPECAVAPEELCDKLLDLCHCESAEGGRSNPPYLILLGDGALAYHEIFANRLSGRLIDVPPAMMYPRASSVAFLAAEKFARGEVANVVTLVPNYIRKSDAEVKRIAD